MDIPRAKAQDQVAILRQGGGCLMNARDIRHMGCRSVSGGEHRIDKRLAGNTGNRFFTGRIDV